MKHVSARLNGKRNPEYQRLFYLKNREKILAKNRLRYHTKYKNDPIAMATKREKWRKYAKNKGPEWVLERSRKYRKTYSELSEASRSSIRKFCKLWTQLNRDRRIEYARQYRRRHPLFGFSKQIADARRSGNIRKLTEICFNAIIQSYERSN